MIGMRGFAFSQSAKTIDLFFRLVDKAASPVSRERRLALFNKGFDLEFVHHLFDGRVQLGLNARHQLRRVVNYLDIRFDAVAFDHPGAIVFEEWSVWNIKVTSID